MATLRDSLAELRELDSQQPLRLPERPTLVVNTASLCGLTPQLSELAALHERLGDRLTVLAIPSNDFGAQEPWDEDKVRQFYQDEHGVAFPVAGKEPVLGPDACAFFARLADDSPELAPTWNFQKYLLGADGELAAMFAPQASVEDGEVERAIAAVL